MSDAALKLVYLACCLALVGAALGRRRLPIGQVARLALVWAAIFAGAYALLALGEHLFT